MNTKLFFLHALSPLHAGTGRGVGMIDLPIAREKATGIPYLPGSSLKGVLRDAAPKEQRQKIFGSDIDSAKSHAGSIIFSDLRILLFPVRSLRGTFAWVTSPLLLRRLKRDANAAGFTALSGIDTPEPEDKTCYITTKNCKITNDRQVILEDLEFSAETKESVKTWAETLGKYLFDDAYWQDALNARFCIISDDMMSFLLETGTEVVARIALEEETKIVKNGALWYEESLPAESILSGLVSAVEVAQANITPEEVYKTLDEITQAPIQVGGNATVGRGFCQLHLV